MNILHIGICVYRRYEGLSAAFQDVCDNYHEVRPEDVTEGLKSLQWRPDIVFLQVQSGNYPSSLPSVLKHFLNKGSKVINWTGDIRHDLPQYMTDLSHCVSISAFSNMRDVNKMRDLGHKSEFLQIGIDPEVFTPQGPKIDGGEIVFMGNAAPHFPNGQLRLDIVRALKRKYGERFKVYGNGWPYNDGECNVKNPLQSTDEQKTEAAIYRGAKVAISASSFTEETYTSDRLFRCMGSGVNTIVHSFPGMELIISEPFYTFHNVTGLLGVVESALNDPDCESIGENQAKTVHNNYTYSHMVQNIINL